MPRLGLLSARCSILDVPQRSPPFSRDAVGHAQRPPDAHLMGSGSPLPYARGGTHSAHPIIDVRPDARARLAITANQRASASQSSCRAAREAQRSDASAPHC